MSLSRMRKNGEAHQSVFRFCGVGLGDINDALHLFKFRHDALPPFSSKPNCSTMVIVFSFFYLKACYGLKLAMVSGEHKYSRSNV